MQLIIDEKIFDFSSPVAKGLITGLKRLSEKGIPLFSSNISALTEILLSEGITISESNDAPNVVFEKEGIAYEGNKYTSFGELAEAIGFPKRIAGKKRATKETKIEIDINLDGQGKSVVETGIGFFDHMLDQIARHGNVDLSVKCDGDLHVDEHHTIEDVGIALGETIAEALGDKKGIKRYGFMIPMDESVARCALDIGGRPHLNFKCKFTREFVGDFPTELVAEFFKGLSMGLKANVYIRCKGKNDHHKIEAIYKAFAKSLNEACRIDERSGGKLPSTKGVI